MSSVAPRVVTGRVITGNVAMEVWRPPGEVRIVVTCLPGHPVAGLPEGQVGVVWFPHPVAVAAGDMVSLVINWMPEGQDYAGPVRAQADSELRGAHIRR